MFTGRHRSSTELGTTSASTVGTGSGSRTWLVLRAERGLYEAAATHADHRGHGLAQGLPVDSI